MNLKPTKIRVLVLCGDRWHPAETVKDGLAALGDSDFEFEFIDDGSKWSMDMMAGFSVVMLAKANMASALDDSPWLGPGSAPAFQRFLEQGGGLVAVHAGISRYENLPLRAAVGGAFVSHPPECDVTLEPQMTHELARDVDAFTVQDEHYFVAFEAGAKNVFLHSRSEHGKQPAGWTRYEGRGRVCVLTPGHGPEVWQHPSFQKLLTRALYWTAALAVKS